MATNGATVRLAISDAVLAAEDVEAMMAAMRTEFEVVRVPLPPRGGPDYLPTILYMALPTLLNIAANITSSALWDGLKLWLTRRRSVPSFYEPDEMVVPGLEIETEEVTAGRKFTVSATLYTTDESILKHAINTLPEEIGKLHRAVGAEYRQLGYDIDQGKWIEWKPDPNAG